MFVTLGRHIGMASLAGMIAGVVVGGLLGRVAMRVAGFMSPGMIGVRTDNGNIVGDITLAGTIALIVFVGVAIGVVGGVLYAFTEPWLRRFRPWHGLIFGVGLLGAAGFGTLDPSNPDFIRFGSAPVNVAMFAALFVLFGVATGWLFDGLHGVAARGHTPARVVEGLAWLALLPVALLVPLGLAGLASGSVPLSASLSAGALAMAVVARWRRFPQLVGYLALAVPVVSGSARLAGSVQALLSGL